MKSFKQVIAEVAQPNSRSEEEQAFKDQHTYEVIGHPVALDHQFTGEIAKPKAARIADQKGDANYDTAYAYGMNSVFEAANLKENPAEEIPMMSQQLDFIAMAAKAIKDSLKGGGDPEEWYQNKLGTAHDAMKTLHANISGDKDPVDESVKKEALVGGQKELDHDKDGDIDGADFAALRAKKKAKTEGSCGTVSDSKKPVKESVESLDETFKQGLVKLKDNSAMVLNKEDADVLNQMFKKMSSGSKKKMTETAMKDKAGFAEILSFAKEAA
tara:strand:- start:6815 stop:7627 length:813 start_codon:yes stop_codon:yes gene_type:complete